MYQRILVPTDGSVTSNHALQEAIKFARVHHAQLKLIHVLEEMGYFEMGDYIDYTELIESVRDIAKKMLAKSTELVRQEGIVVTEKLVEAQGKRIADVIVEEAIQWPADLIIIGTHGRSGFNRLLLGSIAEGVLRTANIPVLLIRHEDSG